MQTVTRPECLHAHCRDGCWVCTYFSVHLPYIVVILVAKTTIVVNGCGGVRVGERSSVPVCVGYFYSIFLAPVYTLSVYMFDASYSLSPEL